MTWQAHCYSCDWALASDEETLIGICQQHVVEGCSGPVILADPAGLCLPFPKTELPIVIRREARVESTGVIMGRMEA